MIRLVFILKHFYVIILTLRVAQPLENNIKLHMDMTDMRGVSRRHHSIIFLFNSRQSCLILSRFDNFKRPIISFLILLKMAKTYIWK